MSELTLVTRHRAPDEIDRNYFEYGRERDDLKRKLDDIRKGYRDRIKECESNMERLQDERRDAEAAKVGKASLGL